MTVAEIEKITISIPKGVAAAARSRAREGFGGNMSAYMADTLRKAEIRYALEQLADYPDLITGEGMGDLTV